MSEQTIISAEKQLKVLVVEDESLIAYDLECLLSDWGYHVVGIASNYHDAVALFSEYRPDFAVVDIHLSGSKDGIDTVLHLNQIKRIPFIYLTAQSDKAIVNRAKASNPAAYLLKPFDERHLSISIDLAFNNFYNSVESDPSQKEFSEVNIHEVKLNADVILKKNEEIFIKQNYRFVRFRSEDILFIEADGNHSYIFTKNQKFIVRISLSQVLDRLELPYLTRIHRSFAININCVEEFDDTKVKVNQRDIPLTQSYKGDFFRNFQII